MAHRTFKGNKQFLPTKPCMGCGKPMTWRKAWANNWEQVKYCSERCRRSAKDPSSRDTKSRHSSDSGLVA